MSRTQYLIFLNNFGIFWQREHIPSSRPPPPPHSSHLINHSRQFCVQNTFTISRFTNLSMIQMNATHFSNAGIFLANSKNIVLLKI